MSIKRSLLNRRSMLLSSMAVGASAAIGRPEALAAAAPSPLKVRVTLDGERYEFDEAGGRDLGDYQGPGFVQRCVLTTVTEMPLSVLLRPDRDSDRVEIVVELGRVWSGPPRHLGPYTVEIERGGKQLARIDVPEHFWFSRWRWQSAPRPVITKVHDLIAAGLLPPYAAPAGGSQHASELEEHRPTSSKTAPPSGKPTIAAGTATLPPASAIIGDIRRGSNGEIEAVARPPEAPRGAPTHHALAQQAPTHNVPQQQAPTHDASPQRTPSAAPHPYTIMGLAGLVAYMPTTGEHDEIGPVTEAQGRWICTGDEAAFAEMFAQAEASGTVPWHVRDEKTGAPFDIEQYPQAGNSLEREHNAIVISHIKCPVVPDGAHHPALTYVPFLLTGDPYFLDALQLQTVWCLLENPPEYRLGGAGILQHSQTRGYAWCLRDLAQLAKVTPSSVPGWMLPRSYWQRLLENNRAWFEKTYVRNPEPPFPIFRITKYADDNRSKVPFAVNFAAWEEEFLCFILGWTVLMGFPAWRDAFTWKAASTIARTNGKSGWVRAYATPYMTFLTRAHSREWPASWKEAWDLNVELQNWHVSDPDRWAEGPKAYLGYSCGVLALATRLGVLEARECFAWADGQLHGDPARVYRWSVRP
ncbi:MAG: hypothetical protein WA459_21565 [Stellaceae bacterium]